MDYPLEAYIWGMTYQIRDAKRRTIAQFYPQSGDINYRKKLEGFVRETVELWNKSHEPNGKPEPEIVEKVMDAILPEPKKRGRPKKDK